VSAQPKGAKTSLRTEWLAQDGSMTSDVHVRMQHIIYIQTIAVHAPARDREIASSDQWLTLAASFAASSSDIVHSLAKSLVKAPAE
jgi:hypothetical protein